MPRPHPLTGHVPEVGTSGQHLHCFRLDRRLDFVVQVCFCRLRRWAVGVLSWLLNHPQRRKPAGFHIVTQLRQRQRRPQVCNLKLTQEASLFPTPGIYHRASTGMTAAFCRNYRGVLPKPGHRIDAFTLQLLVTRRSLLSPFLLVNRFFLGGYTACGFPACLFGASHPWRAWERVCVWM